jgi:WD40 repeat protein
MVSASDDGTAMIWDLRINKRVMLIQDHNTTQGAEIVKAKFFDHGNYVMTAFGNSLATFDLRKPAIILSTPLMYLPNLNKSDEDLNDFDFTYSQTG